MLDGYGETVFFLHPTFIQHSSNISSNMLDEMLDRFASAFSKERKEVYYLAGILHNSMVYYLSRVQTTYRRDKRFRRTTKL